MGITMRRHSECVVVPYVKDYTMSQGEEYFLEKVAQGSDSSEETPVVKHLYGVCLGITAKFFKEFGLFDPRYEMYYEDLDLYQRLKAKTLKVRLANKAIIGHFHRRLNPKYASEKSRQYQLLWSELFYRRKYGSLPGTVLFLLRKSYQLFLSHTFKINIWNFISITLSPVFSRDRAMKMASKDLSSSTDGSFSL